MSPAGAGASLVVLVDGTPLSDDEARALWVAFSAHMDEHRGDMAGFARSRGWHAVSPEYRGGRAVLVVQTVPGAPTGAPPARKAPAPRRGPPARAAGPRARGGPASPGGPAKKKPRKR